MSANQLDSERIIETVQTLNRRIGERFPDAGLRQVCQDLLEIARRARQRAEAIGRPMIGIRILSGGIILAILILFVVLVRMIRIPDQPLQAGEFVQVLEAAFNALILMGASVLFFVSLETRVKRARALNAIHELRSIAHVIDMHQLTKDPERNVWRGRDTQSSPKRTMSPFELNRYLDYCSEMLALTGKVAAMYVEQFPDSQAVAAVNDMETLSSGLARKIWQKIMILHAAVPGNDRTVDAPPTNSPPVAATDQGSARDDSVIN